MQRRIAAPPFARVAALAALGVALVGCATKVDRFTVDRVVDRAMASPDLGEVCALGSSLDLALEAATRASNPAHRALVIAEVASALCAEEQARAIELREARALRALDVPDRPAIVRDLRLEAARAHEVAARRYLRALEHVEAEYGPIGGETCPAVKPKDEVVLMLGLVAGLNALLHDRAAGGPLDVPLDTVLRVSRTAPCLSDDAWWHAPAALQATAWAMIPGSGPQDVDAWQALEQAAVAGEPSGVRVARALSVVVSATAGREDQVTDGIAALAASHTATPPDPAWELLDAYATALVLHESDLMWMAERGHRTPALGELPVDPAVTPTADPFAGDDPFGGDPFAPAPDAEPPAEETP